MLTAISYMIRMLHCLQSFIIGILALDNSRDALLEEPQGHESEESGTSMRSFHMKYTDNHQTFATKGTAGAEFIAVLYCRDTSHSIRHHNAWSSRSYLGSNEDPSPSLSTCSLWPACSSERITSRTHSRAHNHVL